MSELVLFVAARAVEPLAVLDDLALPLAVRAPLNWSAPGFPPTSLHELMRGECELISRPLIKVDSNVFWCAIDHETVLS